MPEMIYLLGAAMYSSITDTRCSGSVSNALAIFLI